MIFADNIESSSEELCKKFIEEIERTSFIKRVYRKYHDNDDPQFFQFISELNISKEETDGSLNFSLKSTGGSLFLKEEALVKCIGEAIERYSSAIYKVNTLIFKPYYQVKDVAVDIFKFRYFTPHQLNKSKFKDFRLTCNSKFAWKWGFEVDKLLRVKRKLIPAQLIYFNYRFLEGESKIMLPISTGTAGGTTYVSAALRAIFELIERDAFMLHYLCKIPGKSIDVEAISIKEIKYIVDLCERYRLEWYLIDITTDLEIPTFMSIVVNRTGIGPAISVGLKTHIYPLNAIIGSFTEALMPRTSRRHVYEDSKKTEKKPPSQIRTFKDRALYWYEKRNIKKLKFWLDSPKKKVKEDEFRRKSVLNITVLKSVIKDLLTKGFDIFMVDLTPNSIKDIPYKVVKVIIPQLQPLYLNEAFRYLGTPRLLTYKKRIGKLNRIPHPFL